MGGRKALGEAFFKHVATRRAPSLFKKMMRSLDSGQYHVPKSFEVMSRFPSDELKLHHAPALRVSLPEDQLMQRVFKAFPETRHEPVSLSSLKAPTARRFVWRQMQLLRQQPQLSLQQAFSQVHEEMTPELNTLKRRVNMLTSGHLALFQSEEELQLKAALDTVAAKATK